MNSLVASIVLCVAAQAAGAQCVSTGAAAAPAKGGALIATAAAGTRDAPALHKVSATPARAAAQPAGSERPRPTGAAMVWTAVAIMSAIALRRAGMSGA